MNTDIEPVENGSGGSGGTGGDTGEIEGSSVPSPVEVMSGGEAAGTGGDTGEGSALAPAAAFVGFLLVMAFWADQGP